MIRPSILLFLVFNLASGHAQPATSIVRGMVYVDKNGNGIHDSNEPGLPGVVVSDQVNAVRTDANGSYQLSTTKGYGFIFISVPSGYKAPGSFWQKSANDKPGEPINFALVKTPDLQEFSFIQASDTHVSEKTVDRMLKLRAVVDSAKPDFMMVTGDLVRDALRVSEKEATGYFELYRDQIRQMPVPVWNVPGNHENFGIERQTSLVSPQNPLYGRNMYHHYFGPDYYSFNYGGVHFIGLNSVDFEDLWYYGHIDSIQLQWLKQDLELMSPGMPVVTFNHIPFYSGGFSIDNFKANGFDRTIELEKGVWEYRHIVSNAVEVIELLRHYNYPLALSGHLHSSQRYVPTISGQQLRFEQTAAVIAPLDNGPFHFPSGVTLYHVKNGVIGEGKFIPLDKN